MPSLQPFVHWRYLLFANPFSFLPASFSYSAAVLPVLPGVHARV
jgi:hypothetical protein